MRVGLVERLKGGITFIETSWERRTGFILICTKVRHFQLSSKKEDHAENAKDCGFDCITWRLRVCFMWRLHIGVLLKYSPQLIRKGTILP